ncbi:unnamed protein product [Brassica rapa subsp. narinosa]
MTTRHMKTFKNMHYDSTVPDKHFPITFIPNWIYYPIDYQMSLDEDLQFYMDKRVNPPVVQDIPKKKKRDLQSQECPPEYFKTPSSRMTQ